MKKFFIVGFVFIHILVLSIVSHAANLVYAQYHFRDPALDGNFVFGNENYCFVFYPLVPKTGSYNETIIQNGSVYNVSGQYSSDKLYCITSLSNNLSYINLNFYNTYDVDIDILFCSYDSSGTVRQTSYKTIPSSGSNIWQFSRSSFTSGFFSSNITMDPTMAQFPLANVSFSNDIDYTGQMAAIHSILNTVSTTFTNYYSIMSDFLQDFFYEDNVEQNVVTYNWAYYCGRFDNFAYNMMLFARDFNEWYNDIYEPKTDLTNQLLQDILDYLTDEVEEVTIEDSMSEYNEMESARDDLKVTDENGNELNAADQAEVVFSEAASDLDSLSPATLEINSFIGSFIFGKPILLIPLIVGLALGLIVTILGKNKSD